MRSSLPLLVSVLLFAAAGWAAGNEWEDKCPQYAAVVDTNCRAEIDTALGSLGLPKGISLTSPLLDDQNLLKTLNPLYEKEYSTGNVYYAFDRVTPSAACCFAVCQYDAQICTCLYSNDDLKSTVRRRLYSTATASFKVPCKFSIGCDGKMTESRLQVCRQAAAAAAPSPSPAPVPVPPSPTAPFPILPQPAPISSTAANAVANAVASGSGSGAIANAQANAVGGASSNAVAKASAVSTGKL
ncbi:hypothetical protein V8C86DRAFT_2513192 [Haematococcus lacustris]